MTSLFSAELRREPFPVYDQLRATTPVFREPQTRAWMLFDHGTVKRTLHDPQTFSSATTDAGSRPAQWMIFADPPRHAKLRALVSRAFTSRAVADLEPRIRELSRSLLAGPLQRGEIDLVADYAMPLPLLVIAQLLGVEVELSRLRRWGDAIIMLADTLFGGELAEKAAADYRTANAEMAELVSELVAARRERPTDDLLTRLVEAEVEGERLSEKEIVGFFELLLLAGHETTTNLIDNAVVCLLDHPEQLALLRERPELVPGAVEEVLRYRAPVQTVFRRNLREVELGGIRIAAGSLILPVLGSANRDPALLPDPARFDITREPNPHLGFGHGPHFCVGAPLARLEAKLALADLLELEDLAYASADPWPPRAAFHIHGPESLPLRFRRKDR